MLSKSLIISMSKHLILALILFHSFCGTGQLFQDDFGTGFASISTANWPTACRGGSASSFNTSIGPCAGASDYECGLSGFGSYITTSAIAIPSTGYELTFDFSFNNSFSFPTIEIRTGATCGTTLAGTTTLSNTSGACTPQTINLDAYSGQTIYIRFRSNTSSATFYFDDPTVDVTAGGGGGGSCLLSDDFGTSFASISATNWPSACRGGTASGFNTSSAPCASVGEYGYSLSGFGSYITSMALAIPSTGFDLAFDYSFNYSFSFPVVEIRTGASCGTTLAASTTLTNTSGVCTPQTINLDAYAGQTIYIRFRSNTSSATFYLDEVNVCSTSGSSGDYKWADNFNDNDYDLDYAGNDGDEACTGCGPWSPSAGATLELVPAGGWNGNSNETEAFPDNMPNVYYVKLDRNEYFESPTLDMSGQESLKISFYAKSSSPGTGGGDNWSFSDRLRLQIWDGSSWITVQSLRDDLSAAWSGPDDYISAALPFNYFCFSAYKNTTSPGNYYYNSIPNVNSAYFHSDFKFRVIFEGGFSGSPFAWVDDFTFRADADGYSTMIPCGISFWNQPAATSYGQDTGTSGNNNAEKGVELELDNSINIPPLWASEADDGDVVSQVFGSGESERIVFAVLSEQRIQFAFPKVHFYAPSMGWQSSIMSVDNNYVGPGWRYYAVEYISCDLAGGSIAEPTDDYRYYYSFEYGNEFAPVFYQLNTSGIEYGGGVTSVAEVFNAPDVISDDNCGSALPVELINFSARRSGRFVDLNWETVTENNNAYFEIQRSLDGLDFVSLGKVNGAGTSLELVNYSFEDLDPYNGTSFYRIKQVDFDGISSYSEVRSVEFEGALHIFPNPTSGKLFVYGQPNDLSSLQIVDLLGKDKSELIETADFRAGSVCIDFSDLSPGIYLLKTKRETYKIRKQ
jgi:hypothetical protein